MVAMIHPRALTIENRTIHLLNYRNDRSDPTIAMIVDYVKYYRDDRTQMNGLITCRDFFARSHFSKFLKVQTVHSWNTAF